MMFRANEPLRFLIPCPKKQTTTGNSADIVYTYCTTASALTLTLWDGGNNIVVAAAALSALGSAPYTGYSVAIYGSYMLLVVPTTALSGHAGGKWSAIVDYPAGGAPYDRGMASEYWGGTYEAMCAAADLISSLATASALSSLATTVGLVKTKTDGLPASATNEFANIRFKTDNLPNNTITTLGTLQTDVTAIKTATNGTNLATPLTAIKAKTDNLPSSPASAGDVAAVSTKLGTFSGGDDVATFLAAIEDKVVHIPPNPATAEAVDVLAMLLGSKGNIYASFHDGILTFCTGNFLANPGHVIVQQIAYYDDLEGTVPAANIETAKARKVYTP